MDDQQQLHGVEPAVGKPPAEDHGLGALEPALDKAEYKAADVALDEGRGMQAQAPWLSDEAVADEVPLPPPEAVRGAALPWPEDVAPPGDFAAQPGAPPAADANFPSDPDLVRHFITNRSLDALWKRADTLQKEINQEINNLDLARTLLNQIQAARNYLLAGRDKYEEAERALNEVAYRLAFYRRMRKWSYSIGCWLLAFEMAVAVALAVLMFLLPVWLQQGGQIPLVGYHIAPTQPDMLQWLIDAFKAMLWGGIGGVTGALHALWRHIAQKQDFDKQYTIWYVTNPLMGVGLGAFVYLVMQAGLLSMTAGTQHTMNSAVLTFVLAWLSGYQQNVAYDIIRRVLKVFQVDEPATPASPSSHQG